MDNLANSYPPVEAWEVRCAMQDLPGASLADIATDLGCTVEEVEAALA